MVDRINKVNDEIIISISSVSNQTGRFGCADIISRARNNKNCDDDFDQVQLT